MNEVRVAAPGAGVRKTLVEAKRVNGGETDFFHGALTVGRACHSGIDTWGSFVSVERPILPWPFGPIPARWAALGAESDHTIARGRTREDDPLPL